MLQRSHHRRQNPIAIKALQIINLNMFYMVNHKQWFGLFCKNEEVDTACGRMPFAGVPNGHVRRHLHSPTSNIYKELRISATTIGLLNTSLFFFLFSLFRFMLSSAQRAASSYQSSPRQAASIRSSEFLGRVSKCWCLSLAAVSSSFILQIRWSVRRAELTAS